MRGDNPQATAVANGLIAKPVFRLVGFSIGESATPSAGAKVRIRNGTVSGTVLATVSLAPGESVRDWYGADGLIVPSEALYIEVVSGSVEGSVYTA